jgi:ATP-dependent RNA helicase DDX27
MGVKRSRGLILTIEDDEILSEQSESESEEGQVLDGDFEFDGYGVNTGIMGIEDDGWGFKGVVGMKEGASVDLDGIIARRRKLVQGEGHSDDQQGEEDDDGKEDLEDDSSDTISGEAVEDESDIEEWKGFDDEIGIHTYHRTDTPAEDGFGMGADEEEELGSDHDSGAEDEKDQDKDNATDEEASDSDSVASPQPHPDDLASYSDSEDEAESDQEEKERKAAYFAPDEETTASTTDSTGFDNMFLTRPTLKALAKLNFQTPTQIQSRTIPVALKGKDIVASAVTGSGKTAAFMIPILERLSYRSRAIARTRVLILTPTRELAVQAYGVAIKLAQFMDVKFCLCVGGLSVKAQEAELRKAPDVVIATPGRFIDHVRNAQGFVPDGIEILVIDEADR